MEQEPTTPPDFTPSNKDPKSCDEFAYAGSYNSAGTPSQFGGKNPTTSGDNCVQTYGTRYSKGVWQLFDDTRFATPNWEKTVCGRSSMSNW
ncbi:hypothetical protein [Streptomyces zagrosensis]|uniref:Uncharacterized protein n=1 Tax=Streptomyces zagrosensis TaxID=1042984 RepID=A0A7W9QG02_9ACTN|nr:hypothetical protein [Streptomyces zagrosensis]MBB5939028.1 hypothetical protein [Streptomyces zagrosensis]